MDRAQSEAAANGVQCLVKLLPPGPLRALEELELAEAHYRESLALEPQAAIHNDLGFVLDPQGLINDALQHNRKALELEPN